MAKKNEKNIVRYCRDCALSKPDMKFENLSLDGKPTLLSCPHQEWRMVITTTDVCSHYTTHAPDPVTVEPTETKKNITDGWLDW